MKCPICNGESFIIKYINPDTGEELGRDDPNGTDTAVPCKCRIERDEATILKNNLTASAIPVIYWNYTFEGYMAETKKFNHHINTKNTIPLQQYKRFLDNPKDFINNYKVLWIYGPHDNAGHTTLAVLIAKELIKLRYNVRFIKMSDLLDIFTDFNNKQDKLALLNRSNIYLLDDAFDLSKCVTPGEYVKMHMYNWVDSALANGKHFICTSSIKLQEMSLAFGHCKTVLNRSYIQIELLGSIV
jgi:DNA replication protein DnaC